jgi:hypothetical protein
MNKRINSVRSSPIRNPDVIETAVLGLLSGLSGGQKGFEEFIDDQSKQGHVANARAAHKVLPTNGLEKYGPDPKAPFFGLGIKVLHRVENDPLFTYVELPEGWTIKQEETYYSYLYDPKGRRRSTFFYKGAFYDQNASMWAPNARYSIENHPDVYKDRESRSCQKIVVDKADEGKVLFSCKSRKPKKGEYAYDIDEHQAQECAAWLDKTYPGWKDPLNYWD